ncbi:Avirulence protein B, partial [Frankliniella fusca]
CIPLSEKREMVARLNSPPPKTVTPWKRHVLPKNAPFSNLREMKISDFVNENTKKFFTILRLDEFFLTLDPVEWAESESFRNNLEIIRSLHVVNDIAERGVALVKRFTKEALTKQEDVFQDLLLAGAPPLVSRSKSNSPDRKAQFCQSHTRSLRRAGLE